MAAYTLTGNTGKSDAQGEATYIAQGTITSTDYPNRVDFSASVGVTSKKSVSSANNRNFRGPFVLQVGDNSDSKELSASAVNTTGTYYAAYTNTVRSIAKGHSSKVVTLSLSYYASNFESWSESKASRTITIPAKQSYVVSYDANDGSGAPTNQTKWYDESLTLSAIKPSKSDYTFKGWATSIANANAGTVEYASSASYTGNAALTLYAVWELTYSKPSITDISVERCDANGNNDDDGRYAKVDFNWSVFTSTASRYYGGTDSPYANNTISSASVTVGTVTKTFTASDTLPIVVGDGSLDSDTQYDVSITITDSQSVESSHTTTAYSTLAKAYFPMDFNADGTALGIFMPAPDDEEGVYIGKDLFLSLDTTATSGTDKAIYDALVSLGWTDVIV